MANKRGMDLDSFVSGLVRALTKGQQALPLARMEQDEIDCDLSDESKRVRYCVTPSKNGSGNFEIDIRFSRKMDSEPEKMLTEFLNGLIEIKDIN